MPGRLGCPRPVAGSGKIGEQAGACDQPCGRDCVMSGGDFAAPAGRLHLEQAVRGERRDCHVDDTPKGYT